ncbi:hypothetical protein H4Q32_016023 [Labeo rohita]|uniref:Paraneoplastic antigen Ma-like C-terminal domain-containing protein n=1 Tax=Labeo rohita TaxID=84645 RepID=A0ABQ8LHV1_LABRO|nr:hypothetical protein H4Q32_016023 [Labeo rohita]
MSMRSGWSRPFCSDNVQARLVECLRGPAADIVRFDKTGNPFATFSDYLSVLKSAFGTTENAADVMLKFRSTYQNEGVKLSAYILRMTHKLCGPPSFNELMKEKESSANTNFAVIEVEKLKREVRGLKNEVSRLSAAAKEPVTHDHPAMHNAEKIGILKCDFTKKENLRRVNQRLIRMRQSSGNFSRAQ